MPGGYKGPTASDYSGITRVTNTGSAETKPQIYIKGSGKLRYIENETSKVKVYLDLVILTDEEIFIDFEKATIQSTVRGDLSYALLPGSDYDKFTLLPGENKIAIFISDGVGSVAHIYFIPKHWSVDSTKVGEAY
jgi:phage-related protein